MSHWARASAAILVSVVAASGCKARAPRDPQGGRAALRDVAHFGGNLMDTATRIVRPVYPTPSVQAAIAGLAVAEVSFDIDGKTQSVNILEAPDSYTGQSIVSALKQWEFSPVAVDGRRLTGTGTVSFRFVLDPAPHVLTQKDMAPGFRAAAGQTQALTAAASLQTEDVVRLVEGEGAVVIDVRPRVEWAKGHPKGARSLPLLELAGRAPVELDVQKPVIVWCYAGGDCLFARQVLATVGFPRVYTHREPQ